MSNEKDNHEHASHDHDIEDIDCTEAIDRLYAYLDNEITDIDTINKVEHHLKHCHSCFTRSQVEQALTGKMRQADNKETPESLQKRLKSLIDNF
jgi:anti-sigma factor (TIGR02949 family)